MSEAFGKIKKSLKAFESVDLVQLDNVQLMKRYDTKFIFNINDLPNFLDRIQPNYLALEIGGEKLMEYDTIYFDTADMSLFRHHQNQKLNRYKLRYRKYVKSDLTFLEIKKKTNKSQTRKIRIKKPDIQSNLDNTDIQFINENAPVDATKLKFAIRISFHRMTLVDKNFRERATIDVGLKYEMPEGKFELPHIVVAEIKQEKFTSKSEFTKNLKLMKVYPTGFSKFSIGVSSIKNDIKKNNFKPILRKIYNLESYASGTNQLSP